MKETKARLSGSLGIFYAVPLSASVPMPAPVPVEYLRIVRPGNSPVYKYHRYLPVNCQLGPFGIAILYKQLIMARLSGVSTRSNRYTFTDSRVDRDSAGSGTGSVCSHHNAHLANQRAFLESG